MGSLLLDEVKVEVYLHLVKTVTMLELRREFTKVLRWLRTGKEPVRLTYRGRPIADLRPVRPGPQRPSKDDAFYRISELATEGSDLSNEQIDVVVYGKAQTDG